MKRFPPVPEYGYDPYSCWRRGHHRVRELLEMVAEWREPGKELAELGSGDGMTASQMAAFGHRVTCIDLEDWRSAPAQALPWVEGDVCARLPVADDTYDGIFSFNTFEHLLEPEQALSELGRILRPGGILYLHFGPLFYSPFGLHAHETVPIPWVHLLFEDDVVASKLRQHGVRDLGRERDGLQPLNRWPVRQFRSLWRSPGWRILEEEELESWDWTQVVERYPEAFRGRGLEVEDLLVYAIRIRLLSRKGEPAPVERGG